MNNDKIKKTIIDLLNALSYEERKEIFSNFEKPAEKTLGSGDDDLYCSGENITNKEMYNFIKNYNTHHPWMEPTLSVHDLVKMYKGEY